MSWGWKGVTLGLTLPSGIQKSPQALLDQPPSTENCPPVRSQHRHSGGLPPAVLYFGAYFKRQEELQVNTETSLWVSYMLLRKVSAHL